MNTSRIRMAAYDIASWLSARAWALLPEKARWRIAMYRDRSAGQCWADLVDWALRDSKDDPDLISDLPNRPIGEMCRRDALACGRCYCGKLAADGSVLKPGRIVPAP